LIFILFWVKVKKRLIMSFFVLDSFISIFNDNDEIFLYYGKEKNTQVLAQVYQKRKIPDSPGGFRFERTKEKNSRII